MKLKASKIRHLRESRGISQLRLAFLANVSRFRLNLAERAMLELRADECENIRQTLSKIAKTKRRQTTRYQGVVQPSA